MPDRDRHTRLRQGRIAALVIAGAGLLWLAAQALWAGGVLSERWVGLADLAALGAFAWAFVVALRLWRARAGDRP